MKRSYFLLLLFGFASFSMCNQVIEALKTRKFDLLAGKKIMVTCNKAPYDDVPSFGLGDAFLFLRFVVDYLETECKSHVVLVPPKALCRFFSLCSDIPVVEPGNPLYDECISVECRDLLQHIPDIQKFESKKRFLGKNCIWANAQVQKIVSHLKKRNIIPVLITRQSNYYKLKSKSEENIFGYLNNRSISRQELADIVQGVSEQVRVYNIQFEDQKLPDIAGVQKPTVIYPEYDNYMGAFVQDAILMKAVLQAGGYVVSVETAAGHLACGVVDVCDTRKNIIMLLGKQYSCRWKSPFLNEDGSVTWSANTKLIIQEKAGDWTDVGKKLRASFN